ncbi:MAG: 50S ribosomal protein L32e [Candidatus Aenigmarchaeota archaeon]|nr:50S ribosomal protein L32e [Candidatus Aenigmarchaeota archaeon]
MTEGIISRLLKLRKKKKAKKPSFRRQEGNKYKRLKETWRRPRGRHSKLRKGKKSRGKKPSAGYSSPKAVRGLTSRGLELVYVSNVNDLKAVDPKRQEAVIRSAVGRKKRLEIAKEAENLGITVQNAYRVKVRGA